MCHAELDLCYPELDLCHTEPVEVRHISKWKVALRQAQSDTFSFKISPAPIAVPKSAFSGIIIFLL